MQQSFLFKEARQQQQGSNLDRLVFKWLTAHHHVANLRVEVMRPLEANVLVAYPICCRMKPAPFKAILDSLEFWIPSLGFRIPGTGLQSL